MPSRRDQQSPEALDVSLARLLDRPYHPHQHPELEGELLTLVSALQTPEGQLVMVLPQKAPLGLILPQFKVREGYSLYAALLKGLEHECNYGPNVLGREVTWLGHCRTVNRLGEVKRLCGLYVQLLSWEAPQTNHKNRDWVLAENWVHLARLMVGCSPAKRQAVAGFLIAAVERVPRFKAVWGEPPEWYEQALLPG